MSQRRLLDDLRELIEQNEELKKENSELKGRKIDASRYYAATLTIAMVSELHGVHPDTVRAYIKNGHIEKHPKSTDAKILIRASEALTLDFSRLRTGAKRRRAQM